MTVIPNHNTGISLLTFAWRGDRLDHQRVAIVGWRTNEEEPDDELIEDADPIVADRVMFAEYKSTRSIEVIETLHPRGDTYRALRSGLNLGSFEAALAYAGFALARNPDERKRRLAAFRLLVADANQS